MAPSTVKMEIPESPIREGDTPSSTESETESGVTAKSTVTVTRKAAGTPASSVHELLECPVCTNSMYPPIHQVCHLNRGVDVVKSLPGYSFQVLRMMHNA
jgi:hypothetical protein